MYVTLIRLIIIAYGAESWPLRKCDYWLKKIRSVGKKNVGPVKDRLSGEWRTRKNEGPRNSRNALPSYPVYHKR